MPDLADELFGREAPEPAPLAREPQTFDDLFDMADEASTPTAPVQGAPEPLNPPGQVTAAELYLKELEATPPPAVGEVFKAAREAVADPMRSDVAIISHVWQALAGAGLADPKWVNAPMDRVVLDGLKTEADQLSDRFLLTSKLSLQMGEANFRDKRLLKRQALAYAALSRAPLQKDMQAGLVKAVTKDLVLRRLEHAQSGAQELGAGQAGTQEWAAWAAMLGQMQTPELNDLWANALYDTQVKPANGLEAEFLKHAEGEHWGPLGLRSFAPPAPGRPGRVDGDEAYSILRTILGPDAGKILLDEVNRNKVRWVRERVGLIDTKEGGIVTGRREDDDSFLYFAPTGAVERILGRQLASDPPLRDRAERIRQDQGPAAAVEFLRQANAITMKENVAKIAAFVSQPATAEPPLTPAEKESQSLFIQGILAGHEALGRMMEMGTAAAESTDRIVSSSQFVRDTFLQSDNPDRARVQDLGEALNMAWHVGTTFVANSLEGLERQAKDLGYEGATGRGMVAAVLAEGSAAEKVHSFLPRMYARVDQNNQDLAQFWGGKLPNTPATAFKALRQTVENTVAGLVAMPTELIATTIDDPHTLGGLAAQGLALAPVIRPLTKIGTELTGRLAYNWRLKSDLQNLFTHHPEKVAEFRETAVRMAEDAAKSGRLVPALNDLVANFESFIKHRKISGLAKDAKEVASLVRRAWPELQEGLGTLGHTLGTKMVNRGRLGGLSDFFSRFAKTPTKDIELILGNMKTTDVALSALQDMTGAKGVALELEASRRNFVAREGRAPTMEEIHGMMPEPMRNMYDLMVAAEKHNIKSPKMAALFRKLSGFDAAKVTATADSIMNEYMSATLRLVDRTRALGLIRQRVSTVLDVARTRLRLDADTEALNLEWLREAKDKLAPEDPANGPFEAKIAKTVDRIQQRNHEIGRIDTESEALMRHDATRPYRLSRDVRKLLFGSRPGDPMFGNGVVSASTLGLMMRLHPVLFEGWVPEMLFHIKRFGLSEEARASWDTAHRDAVQRVRDTRKAWKTAEKKPSTVDQTLKDLRERAANLRAEADRISKVPSENATVDGQILMPDKNRMVARLTQEASEVEASIADRTAKLDGREWTSAEVVALEAAHNTAVADAIQVGGRRARALDQGTRKVVVDPRSIIQVLRLLEHDGLGAAERVSLGRMKDRAAQIKATTLMGRRENPFLVDFAPSWYKGELVHNRLQATGWRYAADAERVERLAEVQNRMTQPERDILGRMYKDGWEGDALPEAIAKKYPELVELLADKATALDRISNYYETETATYREMWEILSSTGRIPSATIKNWMNDRYDPRLAGLHYRARMAKGREADQVLGRDPSLPEHPEMTALGMDWSEFRFRREPDQWRVRIQQTDQVVNKLFPTEEAMNSWMADKYGPDALRDVGKMASDGTRRGRTIYGESVTIGRPITKGEMDVLDPLLGRTPEARLIQLRRALKDAHLFLLSESMNHLGNMVMTDEAFHSNGQAKNPALRKQYVKIDGGERAQQAFGHLAGKWVHRSVLREMGSAARVYDSLAALADGWRDAVEENAAASTSLAKAMGLKPGLLRSGYRTFLSAIKDNLILKSARAWFANLFFSTVSDHLAGTKVFTIEGFPKFFDRLRQFSGERAMEVAESGLIHRARQQGIVGGMFEEDSAAFGAMARRAFGLEDAPRVQELLARRDALHTGLTDAKLTPGVGANALKKLELEILGLQLQLKELNSSWQRNVLKKVTGLFVNRKDVLGRPYNETWGKFRAFYNWMDTAFKLEQFRQLTERGLDDHSAATIVRRFSQDYGNLPSWVRQGNPLLMSLVPAFPYEAMRIGFNALTHVPQKFLSLAGALPMLNLANFATAGMGWNRALAMIEARGKKGAANSMLSLFTTLYLTDPQDGAISDEINVGNILPFGSLFQSRGLGSRIMDTMIPPEKRGLGAQVAALGVALGSNFYLSNPAVNSIPALMTGTDPLTGERLTDQDGKPWKNIRTIMKLLAQDSLPPQGPGGRDWNAFWRSTEAPYSAKTGRPFKADQTLTTIIRGLTGITWRGANLQKVANEIGINVRQADNIVDEDDLMMSTTYKMAAQFGGLFGGGKIPTYGEYNELRDLALQSVDTALTPEARQAALDEARALFTEKIQVTLDGLKLEAGETNRQFRLFLQKVTDENPAAFFGTQNLPTQAATIALLDTYGVRDERLKDLADSMLLSDLNTIRRPADPEMVQFALGMLDERLKDPHASPVVADLRRRLEAMKPMAEVKDLKDRTVQEPLTQLRKKAIREARK